MNSMKSMNAGILLDDIKKCSFETFEICRTCINNNNLKTLYIFKLTGEKLYKKDRILLYFKRGFTWILRAIFMSIISKIESNIAKRISIYNYFLKEYDLTLIKTNKIKFIDLKINFSPSGYVTWIDIKDSEFIKSLNLEFLFNSGGGIWKGDILTCSKQGLFSFHHGDNSINRGGPPGFWEVYYKEDFTGFIIQTLNEKLDDGQIISKGKTTTSRFWINNYLSVRNGALREAKRICTDTINGKKRKLEQLEFGIYSRRLYQNPMLHEIFIYILSRSNFLIKKIILVLFKKKPIWETLFLETNNWKKFELRKGIKIKSNKNRFLADPNLVKIKNKHFIFVEDCDVRSAKAEIACYEILKNQKCVKRYGCAIKEKYHLSFPFTFKFENKLYISVESSSNQSINIYRNGESPLSWEIVAQHRFKDLIPIDPIIFYRNGKWWLIFSELNSENEMYIFYSEDPINGLWESHENNPVIISSEYSRNGGFIKEGEICYRIAQKSGFNNYGKSMTLMRIENISEKTFVEIQVESISPNFNRIAKGTHSLTKYDEFVSFDYWH